MNRRRVGVGVAFVGAAFAWLLGSAPMSAAQTTPRDTVGVIDREVELAYRHPVGRADERIGPSAAVVPAIRTEPNTSAPAESWKMIG